MHCEKSTIFLIIPPPHSPLSPFLIEKDILATFSPSKELKRVHGQWNMKTLGFIYHSFSFEIRQPLPIWLFFIRLNDVIFIRRISERHSGRVNIWVVEPAVRLLCNWIVNLHIRGKLAVGNDSSGNSCSRTIWRVHRGAIFARLFRVFTRGIIRWIFKGNLLLANYLV